MKIKSLKKISIQDAATQKFQNNVDEVLQPVLSCPLLNGILLQAVVLDSSITNVIPHRLGRQYRGFFVTLPRSGVVVWENQATNNSKNLTINLSCNANAIVDIWVF